MAGRKPNEVFVYHSDGTYICMFDNMVEFRKVYYPADTGKRPLFVHEELGIKYHYMEDLELIAFACRTGRDLIKRLIAIHESDFCKKEDNESSKRPVQIYNLKNEVIAEFKNTRLLHKLMPHLSGATISNHLNNTSMNPKSHTEIGLFFRYKE